MLINLGGFRAVSGFVAILTLALVSVATGQQTEVIQSDSGVAKSHEQSEEAPLPQTMDEKASFLIGFDFGKNLLSQSVEVNQAQLFAGIKAALAGEEIGMDEEEIRQVLTEFQAKIARAHVAKMTKLADENLAEGKAFLADYSAREGVTKLESGVMYRVLESGSGTSPTKEDFVRVHYTGRFSDGESFESSVGGEPVQFAVGGVIRGFTEALIRMKPGDKWEVVIPSELAYGANPQNSMEPNKLLIFEIELLEVVKN